MTDVGKVFFTSPLERDIAGYVMKNGRAVDR